MVEEAKVKTENSGKTLLSILRNNPGLTPTLEKKVAEELAREAGYLSMKGVPEDMWGDEEIDATINHIPIARLSREEHRELVDFLASHDDVKKALQKTRALLEVAETNRMEIIMCEAAAAEALISASNALREAGYPWLAPKIVGGDKESKQSGQKEAEE
jgi:hypothetical protein